MADDAIPWMVGGGVEHSVEVARLVSYCAVGGQEGVIGSRDLEVRQRGTPGAGVDVFPGAAAILNKSAGAAYDAYVTRFPAHSLVDIAATGATARTDLIVARIENPFEAGETWPRPSQADIASGNVAFRAVRVISNVGAGSNVIPTNLGYSAIVLARVTLPANTTTVLQSHITDLRQMTSVLSDSDEFLINPAASSPLTATTMTNWPTDVSAVVDVPRWATHVQLRAIMSGLYFGSNTARTGGYDAAGRTQIVFGDSTHFTQDTAYNFGNEGGVDFVTLMTGGRVPVPPEWRGTSKTFRTRGLKGSGSSAITANASSTISLTATWMQQPESNL